MNHRSRLCINHVDNDAAMTPASLKVVATFLQATGVQGFVEERPRELLLTVDLKHAPIADPDILPAKVTVWLHMVISTME